MPYEVLERLEFAHVYIDEAFMFSITLEEHMEHLRIVIAFITKHGLNIKIPKCSFMQTLVKLLGHVVDNAIVHADPEKVEAINSFPKPTDTSKLRSFLGIPYYFRRFFKGFANVSVVLHPPTSLRIQQFKWGFQH